MKHERIRTFTDTGPRGPGVFSSEIISFSGKPHESYSAGVCFHLITQARDKEGNVRSVLWHVQPSHVNSSLGSDGSRGQYISPERYEALFGRPFRNPEGTVKRKLKEGEPVNDHETLALNAADVMASILDHLHEVRKGGARVRATLIPGETTLSNPRGISAFNRMLNHLEGLKDGRRIHNLSVRGARKTKGASKIRVRKSGRIYRVPRIEEQ